MNSQKLNWTQFFLLWPTAVAGAGLCWYQLAGWPQATWVSWVILVVAVAASGYFSLTDERLGARPGRGHVWFNLAALFFTGAGFAYLLHKSLALPATAWLGSIWQILNYKFLLLAALLIIFLLVGIYLQKIWGLTIFGIVLLLLTPNILIFSRGFGFDVFVHAATVRAWLNAGFIFPRTILYNGWHFLLADAQNIFASAPIIVLAQWLAPIILAAGLASALSALPRQRAVIWAALFLLTLNSLWTTSTPQALAFGLLFILLLAITENLIFSKKIITLIAVGIAAIHPLTGIVALALAAWQWSTNKWWRQLIILGTASAPALAIKFFTAATWHWPTLNFLPHIPPNFLPHPIMLLVYGVAVSLPLLILLAHFLAPATIQKFGWLAGALFISALGTSALQVPQIIGAEQNDFARRLLVTAIIFLLPAVAPWLENIFNNYSRPQKIFTAAIIVALALATWYSSFPGWNSVQKTKAININALDQQIVHGIDTVAAGQPYIVLADQVTSATALQQFGFLERQLPEKDFYFYPLPTGGTLYTQYFFPLMNEPITKEKLQAAATTAGVHRVFLVLKPYWGTFPLRAAELKKQTADWWPVGGSLIGDFRF